MFFEDDFVIGGPKGLTGFGELGLDDFGGFSRVGEVVITGRVPGALYVDDISVDETPLEYLLPFVHTATSVAALETAFAPVGPSAAEYVEPDAGEAGDEAAEEGDAAPAAIILVAESRSTDDGLTIPVDPKADLQSDFEPLAVTPVEAAPPVFSDGGDDPVEQGPSNPFGFDVHVTEYAGDAGPPAQSGDDWIMPIVTPAPVQGLTIDIPAPQPAADGLRDHTLGGAFQSLSFLILDTPFVVGDNNLPPTVRPSIQDLMGPLFEDLFPFLAPRSGSWVLGRA